MEEHPFVCFGQHLCFIQQAQFLQKMRIRGPLLPAAGKEKPPQYRRFLVGIFLKSLSHEGIKAALQSFKFTGKKNLGRINLSGTVVMKDTKKKIVEPFADRVNCLAPENRRYFAGQWGDHAHGLLDTILGKLVTELGHAFNQVTFGHQHIDWKFSAKGQHEFIDSGPDLQPLCFKRFCGASEKLVRGNGDDKPVQGFFFPVPGKKGQKTSPFVLVMAFIHGNGVSPGRVDDDRLFKKPPVAISGSGKPGNPGGFGKWRRQAGAFDGRGFS